MKKLFLIAFFAVFISAPAANAQDYIYGGISGRVSFLRDADNSGGGISIESSYDTGLGVSGHVGAAFGNFRIEGELGWQKNDVDKLTITNDGGIGVALGVGSLNGLSVDADGDVSGIALMVNGYYDFDTGGPWKPYVGVGIGYARVSADISAVGVKIVDDHDNVFAYQGMLGIGYEISKATTIYGGYRYFATADPSFEDTAGSSFDSETRSHNIEAGIRFVF